MRHETNAMNDETYTRTRKWTDSDCKAVCRMADGLVEKKTKRDRRRPGRDLEIERGEGKKWQADKYVVATV